MEWTSQSVLLGHSGRSRSLLWRRHAFCLWALTQTRGIRTVRYYTCGCCTESVTRAKIHQTSPVQWLPVSLPPLSKTWGLPCGPVVKTPHFQCGGLECAGLIPGQGTKTLHAMQYGHYMYVCMCMCVCVYIYIYTLYEYICIDYITLQSMWITSHWLSNNYKTNKKELLLGLMSQ